jgi:hypothetical protein
MLAEHWWGDTKQFYEPSIVNWFYQGNSDRNHKLWNIVSTEILVYTPYADAAGMLLHINGNFPMGKLKSSLLS